jgi:uncharacterized protein YecE (DUF72 family)
MGNDMSGPSDKPTVRIGTSGYSFKDWLGTFYPSTLASGKMLSFYAVQFDTVEVNFTYYRMPTARTMQGMANKTPDGFRFFVKAHQSFTHKGDLSGSSEFLNGIAPMEESGKLAGLLFQFPQSFKNGEGTRQFLAEVGKTFAKFPVAIEFRDRSWDSTPVYKFLEDNGLTFVAVDEPAISTLFPRKAAATSDIGYVRFHSRNGANWYEGSVKRYDYLYSDAELKEWLPLFETIAQRAKNVFVYFNNCHRGQAAQNAKEMRELLKQAGYHVGEARE